MSESVVKEPLKIVIFLGSARDGRMVSRVSACVKEVVEKLGMFPIIMDPATLPFELLKKPLHFYDKPTDAPQWLCDTNDMIKSADGFLLLSPEYNGTLSPALTNMIDHFPPASFRHKPAGVVTYSMGSFGGMASGIAILTFMSYLGMIHIPTRVTIPTVQNALSVSGKANDEKVVERMDKLIAELKWYVEAMNDKKTSSAPPS